MHESGFGACGNVNNTLNCPIFTNRCPMKLAQTFLVYCESGLTSGHDLAATVRCHNNRFSVNGAPLRVDALACSLKDVKFGPDGWPTEIPPGAHIARFWWRGQPNVAPSYRAGSVKSRLVQHAVRSPEGFTSEDVIALMPEKSPHVVRNALSQLKRDGVLTTDGKRGQMDVHFLA